MVGCGGSLPHRMSSSHPLEFRGFWVATKKRDERYSETWEPETWDQISDEAWIQLGPQWANIPRSAGDEIYERGSEEAANWMSLSDSRKRLKAETWTRHSLGQTLSTPALAGNDATMVYATIHLNPNRVPSFLLARWNSLLASSRAARVFDGLTGRFMYTCYLHRCIGVMKSLLAYRLRYPKIIYCCYNWKSAITGRNGPSFAQPPSSCHFFHRRK